MTEELVETTVENIEFKVPASCVKSDDAMSDKETIDVYAAQAEKYAAITDGDKINDAILSSFISNLPTAGHVLDLGCGPGTSAGIIAKQVFRSLPLMRSLK